VVYNIIADYHHGHPLILPKPYFISLRVEQGGFGEGTIISFDMKVAGKRQTFRAAITEPEPGRVLVETNLGQEGAVSTFAIEPRDSGQGSKVTITTEGVIEREGMAGTLERILTTKYLQRIYKKELRLLDALARKKAAVGGGSTATTAPDKR
jgi:hypothetical protein